MQARIGQQGEVRLGVLSGVEHDGHVGRGARCRRVGAGRGGGQGGVSGRESGDHGRELGDVGLVARVGVGQQRDAAGAGDDEPEPDQAQIGSFLFRLAPLRDRRSGVAGVDEGGEVGHVQGHRAGVQGEPVDHRQRQLLLDPGQGLDRERVHRVPEPPVVQRGDADLGEPVRRGRAPPLGEATFGTRVDDPVQRRQPKVGAHRQRQPGRAGPDGGVDERGHLQVVQQTPHRGHRPELQVPGPLGQHRLLAGIEQRLDLGCGAHVPLGDHLRFAVHPAHLAQVPVRPTVDHLLVEARHI
jgi:hypothetical protein